MNEQITITYKLTGAGWSECTIAGNDRSVRISASYLSNALSNLVLSAVAIASGFRVTEFRFDEEPGEYRWVIEAIDNNNIRVRVVEFQELWGNKPSESGSLIFEAMSTPLLYAKAIHACATAVREEYGLAGYAEKWAEHAFPEQELSLLSSAIVGWEQ